EKKVLNISNYIYWLKQILDKEKGKVILLGHSNGGRISLNFVSKYPEKIDRLILIDSAGIYHNELLLRIKRLFFSALAKIGKRLTTSPTLRNFLYKLTGESDYKNASKRMGKTMVNLIKSDALLNLSTITVPTLIIWGENDKTLPLRDGEKMHELIKNSKLKVIKNARHSPQLTHPVEVANIIIEEIT
ncbi:MAG: alpha/beta hydrolase, partial [Candidatus Levybacteria bacterium]|nr:alpha/beta hydrolase [Candidatus Levybacteria bacterium]